MDWTSIIVAVIVSIPAYLAFWQSRKNGKATAELHSLVNGQSKKLNDLTAKSSFAEGEKAEKDRTDAKNG